MVLDIQQERVTEREFVCFYCQDHATSGEQVTITDESGHQRCHTLCDKCKELFHTEMLIDMETSTIRKHLKSINWKAVDDGEFTVEDFISTIFKIETFELGIMLAARLVEENDDFVPLKEMILANTGTSKDEYELFIEMWKFYTKLKKELKDKNETQIQ